MAIMAPPAVGAAVATDFLSNLEGPAHGVAQPALWILLALVAVALIKKIPHHIFAIMHRLVPLLFLVLVFHSVILMKQTYWAQAIGIVMMVVFVVGVVAALIALFRLIGARRKVAAIVIAKTAFPEVKTLLVDMQMEKGWPGHEPGQFAFVSSRTRWGAHPFTIASNWRSGGDGKISFIVKELGDTTQDLDKKLPIGAKLLVEGPYGKFNFSDDKARQIWISGGIGITPFVARMNHLAESPGNQAIDLFHSDTVRAEVAHGRMKADAERSGVNLHIHITPEQGRLTGAKIRAEVPDWKSASVWFCGPNAFAAALKLDLMRNGLKSEDFHHELFEMR
jgi:predicted ferric reductase